MSVVVNGCLQDLLESRTLAALLQDLEPPTPFAVACNGEFVPRGSYAERSLQPGDVIDIVHPMAGG